MRNQPVAAPPHPPAQLALFGEELHAGALRAEAARLPHPHGRGRQGHLLRQRLAVPRAQARRRRSAAARPPTCRGSTRRRRSTPTRAPTCWPASCPLQDTKRRLIDHHQRHRRRSSRRPVLGTPRPAPQRATPTWAASTTPPTRRPTGSIIEDEDAAIELLKTVHPGIGTLTTEREDAQELAQAPQAAVGARVPVDLAARRPGSPSSTTRSGRPAR